MLLQTNSYFVPKEKRVEHARLLRRFRTALARVGCDHFEVYEQVGSNWNVSETTGRFVQIMRFRDRKHQQAVQAAERKDTGAQSVIQEFCDLINFPYQQQQGLFAVGFYTSVLPVAPNRAAKDAASDAPDPTTTTPTTTPGAKMEPVAIVEPQEVEPIPENLEESNVADDAEPNSMEHGFGQANTGDFEEAMQRLRPIDVSGAPSLEESAIDEVQGSVVGVVETPSSSDEPAAPTWDATAELVEAEGLGSISDDEALSELVSTDFLPADILPQGSPGVAELAGETPVGPTGESPEDIFEPGEEVELSTDDLNTELAHPENADEFTIEDNEDRPDGADHRNPGGRAWR